MNAMNFIDWKNKAVSLPLRDQQTLGLKARRTDDRGIVESEQPPERAENQQFAANFYQAGDDPQPPVRKGMDRPALGDFLEGLGRQRQPFSADPEDHR